MSFLRKLFQPKQAPFITIVSGLPRSGTSMMMKMIEAGGIAPLIDNIRTADVDNPKGYYEFERVKQLDKGDTAWLPEAQGKVVKIISALLKHLPAGYQYRVIFMQRNMDEVLASQHKMLEHRQENAEAMDNAKMAALFEKHLAAVDKWLTEQPSVAVLYVHYSSMLAAPPSQIERINQFLGGKLDTAKMNQIVDANLYRNRTK